MSKITEVCYQFMQNYVQYNLTLHERKYVNLIHLLNCDDFVIFLSHDKKYFGGKIQTFLRAIIKEAQKSDHYRYH